jgi:uncharacterized membrane protein (UPF0182 family)
MQHLRYPEDMFKVQRHILATYHVTDPQNFYKGTDFWLVPEDPADPSQTQKQPPYRLSVQMPTSSSGAATDPPRFSLTSVYVPTNRSNLAAFIAVDSDATSPDYGHFRILRLPDSTQVQGPSQIANTFAADEKIQAKLLPIKQNSQVVYGNLLTLPVGGGLLYVQPVYALRESGQGSYPVLQFVLASFGKNAGYGTSLIGALNDVLKSGVLDETGSPGGNGPVTGKGARVPSDVLDLLQQADQKYNAADKAFRAGDTVKYAQLQAQAQRLVQQALTAAQNESSSGKSTSGKSTSGKSTSGKSTSGNGKKG